MSLPSPASSSSTSPVATSAVPALPPPQPIPTAIRAWLSNGSTPTQPLTPIFTLHPTTGNPYPPHHRSLQLHKGPRHNKKPGIHARALQRDPRPHTGHKRSVLLRLYIENRVNVIDGGVGFPQ
ncbi:hypothetical protein SCLCIDRAFT_18873 [Scleroderma citrinum Foug A]|uniref:Uncharacterized protein n=1 Tax=Scleroderma citrinum Foug A TaxID=1036808 RepID=A0A0C3EDX7_9AGAM|nr:hypothetical protein SCLCIDRAFT_18873 [Scleroderma citrinum Foug A]